MCISYGYCWNAQVRWTRSEPELGFAISQGVAPQSQISVPACPRSDPGLTAG
jgi:hypothetical protein